MFLDRVVYVAWFRSLFGWLTNRAIIPTAVCSPSHEEPQKLLGISLPRGSHYVQGWPAQNFVQDAGLIGRGWLFGRPEFFVGKTPPQHAAEPRGCPWRPRAPQRVGLSVRVRVRVTSGVELVWADVQGWKLTTHVLHKVLCRLVLHITKALLCR